MHESPEDERVIADKRALDASPLQTKGLTSGGAWRACSLIAPEILVEDGAAPGQRRGPRGEHLLALPGQLVAAPGGARGRSLPRGVQEPVALEGPEGPVDTTRVFVEPEVLESLDEVIAVGGLLLQEQEQARTQEVLWVPAVALAVRA